MAVLDVSVELAASAAEAVRQTPLTPRPSLARKALQYLRSAYSLDLRSLALFRVALGVILLADLFLRSLDLTIFYTDWGVLPRAALLEKFSPADRFSIHLISGQPMFQIALFTLSAIFAVMLIFGARTRFAAIASWFMLVSLQNRNPEILQGGDVYLRQLAFWAIFLPIGAMYSVDRALRVNAPNFPRPDSRSRFSHFSMPGIALMLQVAFVYAFAVLLKSGPSWHSEHSAVYYALSIQQMSTPVGRFLLHFPRLLPWLTRGALLHEATIPFLLLMPVLFGPVRTLGVFLILLLHFALGISIRLGHFPWIAAMAALPLLPSWFWETLVPSSMHRRFSQAGAGTRLYYDERCSFSKKTAHILHTLLMVPSTELLPLADSPQGWNEMLEQHSWIVVDAEGRRRYRFDALAHLLSCSPLFACVGSICNLQAVAHSGDRCWRSIESRREQLGDLTGWLKFRPLKITNWKVINVSAFFVILYVFLWNLSTVTHVPFRPAQEKFGITLALDQEWNMFSPYPLTYDGWYVIEGHLQDGSSADLLHPDRPVSFAQPASIADQYKNERWRKYLMNLSLPENAGYRLYYGRYFCRSWNTGRSSRSPRALVSFDIFFMGRQNSLTHPPTEFSRDLLWHHECFK